MNIDECFTCRLLRRITPNTHKAHQSLQVAKRALQDSKQLLKTKIYDVVLIKAYTCFFHAARCLLYLDGVQEKSHYAVFIYIKHTYAEHIDLALLSAFDTYRTLRHDALYGLELDEDAAETVAFAVQDAERFLDIISQLAKQRLDA